MGSEHNFGREPREKMSLTDLPRSGFLSSCFLSLWGRLRLGPHAQQTPGATVSAEGGRRGRTSHPFLCVVREAPRRHGPDTHHELQFIGGNSDAC